MIEVSVSIACRVCHAGWYGSPDERCPRCRGSVVVTGTFAVVDLHDLDLSVMRAGFRGYDDCPLPCLSPWVCSERGSCDLRARFPDVVA